MIRLAILTSFTALATGCANVPSAPQPVVSAEEWAARVEFRRDDFERVTRIKGADLMRKGDTVFLRATLSDALPGQDGIVLYVIARMDEWKFLDRAFTSDGKQWPMTTISRDVRYCSRYGCSLAEHVAVHLPRVYLATTAEQGFDVKIGGKRGDEYYFVPGRYVQGFLMQLPALPKPN